MKKLLFTCRVPIHMLFFLLVLINISPGFSQGTKQLVTIKSNDITLSDVFKSIKTQTGLTVFYSNTVLNDKERIRVDLGQKNLSEVMNLLLKDRNISWTVQDQFIVLKKTEPVKTGVAGQKQPIRISGKVVDSKGLSLQGVIVRVKDTPSATVTNDKGEYVISASNSQAILIFSFLGFQTQETSLGSNKELNVILQEAMNSLNEVVVIGYGTQVKRDLTGAVGAANVKDMQKAPVPSFDQALAGRIAGVNVSSNDGQPGAAATITVRGSSVTQDASPLFVIDGFPIENMDINSLNPNDIASLEVLKDASSIAIYGARGANGVILINTKRGTSGPPRVTYSNNTGFQKAVRTLKMMGPYDFVKMQLDIDSVRSTPSLPVNTYHDIYLGAINPTTQKRPYSLDYYKTAEGYDWQKLLLRTGTTQNHSLGITGGNSETRYLLNGSYYDQKGLIINTGLKRYEGKFSLDQTLRKNVKIGLTANYSSTTSYGTIPTAGSGGGVVQGMWQYRPVNAAGSKQDLINSVIDSLAIADFNNGTSTASLGNNLVNPLVQAQNEYRSSTSNTGTLNAFLEYNFLKKFTLRISGGFNATILNSEAFYNSQTQQGNIFKNSAGAIANTLGINGSINKQTNSNYLNENILTYRSKVGKNQSINALAGFTYQYASNNSNGFKVSNIEQAGENFGINNIGAGTANSPQYGGSRWQLYSFLSRVNYTINDRYLFTATGRADGSSKFAQGKQWGYFPSGAFAWRFSDEPFMKQLKNILNDGKFRVSYGSVGNNKVGDYSYVATISGGGAAYAYPFGGVYTRGAVPYFNGNSDLKWETTTQLDLGINLSFYNDRINLEVDYYQKRTKDLLLLVNLPYLGGYSQNSFNTQYQNAGAIDNNGLEFTLNTINIKTKKFTWSSSFNISFNKSRVDHFYSGFEVMQTGLNLPGGNSTTAWVATEGGSISQFYGYIWNGVYQYTDFDKLANGKYVLKNGTPTYSAAIQPGDPKYKDINGDGVVDANDQTTLGTPLPIHTGGFSNNFTYKNISLNVFLQWSYGNQVLNMNRMVFETTGGYFPNGNQFEEYVNRWSPTNPTNDIPRLQYNQRGDVGNGVPKVTSRLIEDASFLRLKTVSMSYELSPSLLKKVSISNLRISVAAQNILTWTKYSGIDPEVSTFRVQNNANSPGGVVGASATSGSGYTFVQPSSSYSALSGGLDYTPYPRAFTLSLGLNATF